nr:hypothetical protein [Tanacetum cinerariifolium]
MAYRAIFLGLDTAYVSSRIRCKGKRSYTFSCEVQTLIRHIFLSGYGIMKKDMLKVIEVREFAHLSQVWKALAELFKCCGVCIAYK